MNVKVISAFVIAALLVVGAIIFFGQYRQETSSTAQEEGTSTQGESSNGQAQPNVLAGNITPYKEFTKSEYDKAVSEGKVIFLNFYANWCPICRAEEPDLFSGFNDLNNPNVVGFRVNYKDDETDEAEGELAREHGITYQHSKVIIAGGSVVYRQIAERWDSEKVIQELSDR